jgi:hypothetical protein
MVNRVAASSLLVLLLTPLPAAAGEGVIEINEAAVLAAGGFPFNLPGPGSYRLTGNLDLSAIPGAENITAIGVGADDVTLDLNGFAIIGPTVCSGFPPIEPVTCAPTGSGNGISGGGSRLSVADGVVRGFGNNGISCGGNCRVELVKVEDCGAIGIQLGEGGIAIANSSRGNGGTGIRGGGSAVIRENTADFNGADGIGTDGGGVVSNNTANFNRIDGITVLAASTVVANVTTQNLGDGISTSSATVVRDNSSFLNGGYGINFTSGTNAGYVSNALGANTLGEVTGGTPLGPNLCGVAACP